MNILNTRISKMKVKAYKLFDNAYYTIFKKHPRMKSFKNNEYFKVNEFGFLEKFSEENLYVVKYSFDNDGSCFKMQDTAGFKALYPVGGFC